MTAPFIEEISGFAIIKILDESTYSTMLIKLIFMHNAAILGIVNNDTENYNFEARGDDRDCRFKVVKILQN